MKPDFIQNGSTLMQQTIIKNSGYKQTEPVDILIVFLMLF